MTTLVRPARRARVPEIADREGEWLPIPVAALRLNLSVDAVRRRLKRGDLSGRRVRSGRGERWEVRIGADALEPGVRSTHDAAGSTTLVPSGGVDAARWVELMRELLAENAELGRQVGRLNEERAELFGRCGFLQGQLAAAQDQLKALEAPREPAIAPIAARPRGFWSRLVGR
jgi:hypothetical protein